MTVESVKSVKSRLVCNEAIGVLSQGPPMLVGPSSQNPGNRDECKSLKHGVKDARILQELSKEYRWVDG